MGVLISLRGLAAKAKEKSGFHDKIRRLAKPSAPPTSKDAVGQVRVTIWISSDFSHGP